YVSLCPRVCGATVASYPFPFTTLFRSRRSFAALGRPVRDARAAGGGGGGGAGRGAPRVAAPEGGRGPELPGPHALLRLRGGALRSEVHTSELQSREAVV